MSEKPFLTVDEFEARIKRYDLLGAGAKAAGESEDRLRLHIANAIEVAVGSLSAKMSSELTSIHETLHKEIKTFVANESVKLRSEVAEIVTSGVSKIKKEILDEVAACNVTQTHEINSSVQNLIRQTQEFLDAKLKTEASSIEEKVSIEAAKKQDEQKNDVEKQISSLIENLTSTLQNSMSCYLTQSNELVLEKIKNLSDALFVEIEAKSIDKVALEARIARVTSEIKKQAQAVIDFNLSQARAMMEQSAKAEIEKGVRDAAHNLLADI